MVLHELGHVLVARYFRVPTVDIIISPIGGLARLSKTPEKAVHELLIALGGPMTNLFIVGLLAIVATILGYEDLSIHRPIYLSFSDWNNLLPLTFWMNLLLVFFNLLPAFPMDGGRVLRSALAMRTDPKTATNLAAMLGQLLAVLIVLLGILEKEPIFVFIGLFIFISARMEMKTVVFEQILKSTSIGSILVSNSPRFSSGTPMKEVLKVYESELFRNFLIYDFSMTNIVGILTEDSIKRSKKMRAFHNPTVEFMTMDYEVLHRSTSLKDLLSRFQTSDSSVFVIEHMDEIVGTVSKEDLTAFIGEHSKLLPINFQGIFQKVRNFSAKFRM